jgi:hypothetical protein
MERRPNAEAVNSVTQSIDGATGDITMSGDAMRWSPELADGQAGAVRPLAHGTVPAVDVAAGFGALLGLDAPGVRRLVSGAVTSLATVAGDVVAELRQLTRGADEDEADGNDEEGAADQDREAPTDSPPPPPTSP